MALQSTSAPDELYKTKMKTIVKHPPLSQATLHSFRKYTTQLGFNFYKSDNSQGNSQNEQELADPSAYQN